MKLFFIYLKSKKGVIAFFLFVTAIFAVSSAMFRVHPAVMIYPAALCVLFGAIFILLDYIRVKKRYDTLLKIQRCTAEMTENIPAPDGIVERGYLDIAKHFQAEAIEIRSVERKKYRDMTDYYTVWAHQIKTPIASMKLSLQNGNTALRLKSELFRIEQYVEMVLAFLRLDSEGSDYVFREYELDAIVKAAIRKFAPEFIERKISLSYEPINKKIITDEKWLSFVIEQVLSNALKYTVKGTIRIYLNRDALCVSDTGIGIAPEDMPRIFEKGFTGYNGRAEKSASGIGLYLCKRVCDNLGVKISAESEVGKGTTVFIDVSQYKLRKE